MKISVAIPLFQKAPYVARCLDSVAAQTHRDFEVIVVDDGSTDGGGDIVLSRQDRRFRLVRQDNAGEGAARNRALAEASCEWVAFLDADDEWRPGFLEAAINAVESRDVVGVFTNLLIGDDSTPALSVHDEGLLRDYFSFAMAHGGVGMTASSSMVRRAAFLDCGGFRVDVPVGADQDAWARLAWSGPLAYVPAPLAVYYPGLPGSATTLARIAPPRFPEMVRSYRGWRGAGRIPTHVRRSSSLMAQRLLLDHVAALLNQGRRGAAIRVLLRDCEVASWGLWRHWTLTARLMLPLSIVAGIRTLAWWVTRDPITRPAIAGS